MCSFLINWTEAYKRGIKLVHFHFADIDGEGDYEAVAEYSHNRIHRKMINQFARELGLNHEIKALSSV